MRPSRPDPFLDRMRESLSLPGRRRKTRLKLIGSMAVLAVVLLWAAIQQFGRREDPLRDPVPSKEKAIAEDVRTGRAVFGQGPNPTYGAPGSTSEVPLPERSRSAVAAARGVEVPEDLRSFLEQWRNTLIGGEADSQAALYGNRVERFFTKRNVSRDEVRMEKQRLLARYPEFHKYDISGVRVESLDENRAVLTFRKEWDARGRGRFAGAEQQRLTLRKESGSWRIVGEEETKIHWVRRS